MIDFYYWGTQCPYNYSIKKILDKIKEEYNVEVNYYDITDHPEIAEKLKIFSPTMTIFDNQLRWSGPITHSLILKYLNGEKLYRKPYVVESKNKVMRGELKGFKSHMHKDIVGLCCQKDCIDCSQEKSKWMKLIIDKYKAENLGVLHYVNGECVGGVEYVPSIEVPYNIPKSKRYAFLTCLFPSDPVYDYKSHPLRRLEEDLRNQGYTKLYAIASEEVSFPNGPLEWFLNEGYDDLGLVYYEENDNANQHLIGKVL